MATIRERRSAAGPLHILASLFRLRSRSPPVDLDDYDDDDNDDNDETSSSEEGDDRLLPDIGFVPPPPAPPPTPSTCWPPATTPNRRHHHHHHHHHHAASNADVLIRLSRHDNPLVQRRPQDPFAAPHDHLIRSPPPSLSPAPSFLFSSDDVERAPLPHVRQSSSMFRPLSGSSSFREPHRPVAPSKELAQEAAKELMRPLLIDTASSSSQPDDYSWWTAESAPTSPQHQLMLPPPPPPPPSSSSSSSSSRQRRRQHQHQHHSHHRQQRHSCRPLLYPSSQKTL